MTSKKQIAANQENAKKSKGPITTEGKEASRMNAIKHGLLSSYLFIATGKENEQEEFADFAGAFIEEMQPVGLLETLLADRIFGTFWRLRRLHIAETGFIQKQIEPQLMQQAIEKLAAEGIARKDVENGFFLRMRTSTGCSRLSSDWQTVVESLQKNGLPLSAGMTQMLNEELGGNSGFWKAECISRLNWIVQNKGGSKPMNAEDEKVFNEGALTFARDLQGFFQKSAELLELNENDVRKADLRSKMIPSTDQLEKLQRYEAHLQRVMLQTLHEFQRIQSIRLGHPAPLSAALDVMLDNGNGFVS